METASATVIIIVGVANRYAHAQCRPWPTSAQSAVVTQ